MEQNIVPKYADTFNNYLYITDTSQIYVSYIYKSAPIISLSTFQI
jgi:hypothetical protein